MADYTDRDKATIFDELCAEFDETDWFQMWKSPSDDSWVIQIDGTLSVSAFTAQAIQDLMKRDRTDG